MGVELAMPNYREEPDGSVRKQCSKCKEWRRPEGFGPNRKSADLLESQCLRCKSKNVRSWESRQTPEKLADLKVKRSNRSFRAGFAAKYFSKIYGGS